MMLRNILLSGIEKAYKEAKDKEAEELHNAIAQLLVEHKASLENELFVLDLIRFELMQAKYKEIMGVVKLTDKPPLKKVEKAD